MNEAEIFFQKCGVSDFSIDFGSREGWRCRAKLAVRQIDSKIIIGLFQEGSHDISPLYGCPDHHPRINEAIDKLRIFFSEEKITGYNEKTHSGEVRYLQCIVERRTGRVQVSVVINTPYGKTWADRLKRLYEKDRFLFHSLWINVQPLQTNTIFSKEWYHIIGKKYVWESICGYEIPFLPTHFGQANLEMFERLLWDMFKIFPKEENVAELFSGIGIISTVLRPICRSIILYEVEPSAEDSFLELKNRFPLDLQDNCDFIVGDANTAFEVCEKASTIIVDPPRKGVSKAILETILQKENIHRMLYVSCCLATFKRDAEILISGGFSIAWAKSYTFFPGTDHLETMCLFSRKLK